MIDRDEAAWHRRVAKRADATLSGSTAKIQRDDGALSGRLRHDAPYPELNTNTRQDNIALALYLIHNRLPTTPSSHSRFLENYMSSQHALYEVKFAHRQKVILNFNSLPARYFRENFQLLRPDE